MNMPNALLLMWKTTLDSGSKIPKYPLKWYFIIFPFKLRAQPKIGSFLFFRVRGYGGSIPILHDMIAFISNKKNNEIIWR